MRRTELLLALGLFLFFLLPPTDPDLGWHLRYGQEIWQTHSIPRSNTYSVLLEGYQWVDHNWLYQVAIYPLWSAFGGWGLTLFNAVLLTTALLLFYHSIRNFRLEKILLILLTLFLGRGVFSFGLRSQLLGFLFFCALLYLLATGNSLRRTRVRIKAAAMTAAVPLTMLLWANSHGSVVLGLALISVFLLQGKVPTLLAVVSSAATFVNPFGLRIYGEAWRHLAGGVDLSTVIAEWVPPLPYVWWFVALSAAALVFLLIRESLSMAMLVASFAVLALKARRSVPLYLLVGASSFLTSKRAERLLVAWREKRELRDYLFSLLAALLVFYGLLVRLPQTVEANNSWENFCRVSSQGAPCAAVEFLRGQKERGNIFNRYEWGGFLLWQLPEYQVFVDGRMPAWDHPSGKSPYTIYLETLQTQEGWQQTLADYGINWILISPGTFMDLKLRPDPAEFGWQEVFRDRVAVLYQRI